MSTAVLASIQPRFCELIVNGKKRIEVRKTRPNLETPFKGYIYCTKNALLTRSHYNGLIYVASHKNFQEALERNGNVTLSGKVIGEFVCNNIFEMFVRYSDPNSRIALRQFPFTGLTDKEIMDYLGNGKMGYGWDISDLLVYDKPKPLSDFQRVCNHKEDCGTCKRFSREKYDCIAGLTRPPQSWCYVEEIQ